jgi:cell division transport system permease protein
MSLLFAGRKTAVTEYKVGIIQKIIMTILNHIRQLLASLGELWRQPLASLMTIAVLGLSITLPSTLYLLVKNTEQVTAGWEQAGEISLYLKPNTSVDQAKQLRLAVSLFSEVDAAELVTADVALVEFEQASGLTNSLAYLDKNPLPHVILVTPKANYVKPAAARTLVKKLERQIHVDFGKLDIEWLERLYATVSIARDVVWIVAILLCVSVVLIIGNTIRLNILSQREEIIIMKLVGATDNFIRFPFLYTGMWYGLLGGVLAWIFIAFLLWWLQSGIANLANLYQTQFTLTGLDTAALGIILLLSIILGLLGSIISVQKHIKEIEPK